MPTPFTSAQRAALKRTVRSLMRDKDAHTSANCTLSPPSDAQHHSRASHRHKTTGTRPLALVAISTNGVVDADAHPAPPRAVLRPVAAPALPATVPLTRTAHHTAGRSATPTVIAVSPVAITEQRTWICQRYHVSSGVSSDVVSSWY